MAHLYAQHHARTRGEISPLVRAAVLVASVLSNRAVNVRFSRGASVSSHNSNQPAMRKLDRRAPDDASGCCGPLNSKNRCDHGVLGTALDLICITVLGQAHAL
jgi:hypothetical protein